MIWFQWARNKKWIENKHCTYWSCIEELVMARNIHSHIHKRIQMLVNLRIPHLVGMWAYSEVHHCHLNNCMHRWNRFSSVSTRRRWTGIVSLGSLWHIDTRCMINICHRFDMAVSKWLWIYEVGKNVIKSILVSWAPYAMNLNIKSILREQSGTNVWSARDGAHSPFLQIIFVIDEPSGNVWPLAQAIVQLVELHDNFELCGWTGRVRQSFFSCSQYGPTKFSGHWQVPGSKQIPLFLHGGIQMAINALKSLDICN